MQLLLVASGLATLGHCSTLHWLSDGHGYSKLSASNHTPVTPKLRSTPQILGLVNDPALNRDSCGSARFDNRTFWTCRDTQLFNSDGSVQVFPVITSTASWSDYDADGTPALIPLPAGADILHSTVLRQYGNNSIDQAYYPVLADECDPPAGGCPDGSRFAIWPDLPPMVTSMAPSGHVTAYTWIRKSHIEPNLSVVTANPATTLYRVEYDPSIEGIGDQLPSVSVVAEEFWAEGQISFGNYGNVVRDGVAYLYGQANGTTALAKVPAQGVEDKSQYQYWVNGSWTNQMPSIGQAGVNIANASAGGQGTYYYSEPWQSYVWIGGSTFPGAEFYITTAPEPMGPWIEPIHFYSGVNGDYFLSAYSIQANPALTNNPSNNSIFVTYTKNDLDADGVNVYTTPLVYVEWE